MKRMLVLLFAVLSTQFAYADGSAQMKLNITDKTGNNNYYLCVYGSGCYNIKELNGKTFPVMPDDLSNDTKMAVLDVQQFQLNTQPNTVSCEVNDASGKTVTISGKLSVNKGQGTIQNLRCQVA